MRICARAYTSAATFIPTGPKSSCDLIGRPWYKLVRGELTMNASQDTGKLQKGTSRRKMDEFRWNLRKNVEGNLVESPKREGQK